MNSILKLESKSADKNPKELFVNIPKIFRDNDWSDSIGSFQKELNVLTPDNKITFDFTESRWIDPLPLLSLLIEIVRVKKMGISIDAIFPDSDNGEQYNKDPKIYQKSPNRLLLFLAKEGFFTELVKHISFLIGKDDKFINEDEAITEEKLNSIKQENTKLIIKYQSLPATPSYTDSYFIPFKLYLVPILPDVAESRDKFASGFVAETVDKLLDGVELTLHAKCSASERRYLLYNLRAILQELLHNVQEHAYSQETIRLAALYVRYRQGGAVLSSENEKNLYQICADEEHKYCKMTNADWLNARRGCLEVFFLDRGVGLVNHFRAEEVNNALKEVMFEIFFEGKSNKPRRTEYGGVVLASYINETEY